VRGVFLEPSFLRADHARGYSGSFE